MMATAEGLAVLIAAPFPEVVALHQALTDGVDALKVTGTAHSAAEVLLQAMATRPSVVLLSDGFGPDTAEAARVVRELSPACRIVVLSRHPDAEAMASGVAAVLGHDASPQTLRMAIRVAAAGSDQGEPTLPAPPAPNASVSGPSGGRPDWLRIHDAAPEATEAKAAGLDEGTPPPPSPTQTDTGLAPGRRRARVILVLGGKGGVGKSVVATNVAVSLAQDGATVAIVDLDRTYGDVGVMLRVEAHPSTAEDLIDDAGHFDPTRLERSLATGPAGVRALLTSSSAQHPTQVSPAAVAAIIAELSRRHDFVVIDTASPLDEPALTVMTAADTVLVVTAFSITSVKNTKILLKALAAAGVDERLGLVLNQLRPRILFARSDIERSLGLAALTHLPYEATIDDTIDTGVPIVIAEPRAEVSRQLAHLAEQLRDPAGLAPEAHDVVVRRRFGRRR